MARDWTISEDPVQPLRWLGELRLLERLGEHSWVVRAAGADTEAVARPIAIRGGARLEPAALIRTTAAVIGPGDPALVPAIGIGNHRRRPWVVSEFDLGVDLRRFLDVVRPSPAQALLMAADVLSAVCQLHDGGRVHTRLHAGNVQIGPDGTARLGDWAVADPPPPDRAAELRRDDLVGAAEVIAALARAARCPAGSAGEPARILIRLPRQLRARSPQVSPDRLLDDMQESLGDEVTRDELRAETAQLVAAAARPWNRPAPAEPSQPSRRAGRDEAVPPIRQLGPEQVPVPPAGPAPRAPRRSPRSMDRAAKTVWSLALALAVLGLVVGAELTFLHRPIVRDLQALRQPAPASSSPATTLPPAPTASVPPGGPLRSVDVRSLQPCGPGRPCPVRVLIDVQPQPRPVAVAWTFELRDRCSASTISVAGGGQTLAAGRDQVVGVSSVSLPAWVAVQLLVRTTAPESATSAPLMVPTAVPKCGAPAPAHH